MPQISKSLLPTSVSNFVRHFLMFFCVFKAFLSVFWSIFLLFYHSLHPVIVNARCALPQNQIDQPLCRRCRTILRLQKPFSRCFCLFSRYLFPLLLIIAQFLRYFVNLISVFYLFASILQICIVSRETFSNHRYNNHLLWVCFT